MSKDLLEIEKLMERRQFYFQQRGLYFLFDGDELVYVGQTEDLDARLSVHRKSEKKWNSYAFLPCFLENMDSLEARYIIRYSPRYNVGLPGTSGSSRWTTYPAVVRLAKSQGMNAWSVRRFVKERRILPCFNNIYYLKSDFADLVQFGRTL